MGRAMKGAAILALGLFCAGCGQVADAQASLLHTLQVKDAIADYGKASTPLDRCVKAKLVAAAYTDAKDAAETAAWEAREGEDCRQAAAALHVVLPAKAGHADR
jgi:hypothetical protein